MTTKLEQCRLPVRGCGKLGSIVGVLVAAMCDLVLRLVGDNFGFELPVLGQSCLITPVVTAWYFFTELGSIIENAAAMGAPVPGFLKKLIVRGKKAIDDKTGSGDNKAENSRCGEKPHLLLLYIITYLLTGNQLTWRKTRWQKNRKW